MTSFVDIFLSNPTPEPVQAPFEDKMTTWEPFSLDDGLKVFDLDYNITTHENFRQQRNYFYRDFIAYLTQKDFQKSNGTAVEC